jgi:hypothetical protein
MNEHLNSLVDDLATLNNKLILIIGGPQSGKTALLRSLARQRGAQVFNVGATLSSHLAVLPQRQRAFQTNVILRELAREHASGDLLLVDNIELLFDQTLQLDPLDLLKRHAHARRVVAVWPGEIRDGRLIYADAGHPEHRTYGLDGFVRFEMESY